MILHHRADTAPTYYIKIITQAKYDSDLWASLAYYILGQKLFNARKCNHSHHTSQCMHVKIVKIAIISHAQLQNVMKNGTKIMLYCIVYTLPRLS